MNKHILYRCALILCAAGVLLGIYSYAWHENKFIKYRIKPELLSRRYNEVAYAATHNGQSYLKSPVQNQNLTLTEQFERGIRATKLHVWYDRDADGKSSPYVCHGVPKNMLDDAYLEKVIEKVPRIFRSWARSILQQYDPLNELVRDACKTAYGHGDKEGVIQFRHGILDPASKPLSEVLTEIKVFLDQYPDEIFTVILEDHTENLERIAQDFKVSGLKDYAHIQDKHKEWPTLGQMVKDDKRLVVLLHGEPTLPYKKHPWMHPIWDFAYDTEWEFGDVGALKDPRNDRMPKRGTQAYDDRHNGPKNKLFIVHHFITPRTGGCSSSAKKVNKKVCIQDRLNRLKTKAGRIPNIIQVDFFEYPKHDIFEVVDTLNMSATA
ncbi:MAG: hypothetical protein NTX86_01575 [Candidatus Dependentiae bacterium]|nr:hypothetical protein [Candidatus Dependentiae bacterium]